MQKKVGIIGSGVAGLCASAVLAQNGHSVNVFEKNSDIGGRMRQFSEKGFHFDMGPSWYWMPQVMERFFKKFGKSADDFFELKKLDPGFQMIFDNNEIMTIPESYDELRTVFEKIEKGSANQLDQFMKEAEYKYKVGIDDLVYKPGLSLSEFASFKLMRQAIKLQIFSSFDKHVRKFFKHPHLISLMEFPILFLGAMPQQTPALYSLMNYAGLQIGTFYPKGGLVKLTEALHSIALEQGVEFHANEAVNEISFDRRNATSIISSQSEYKVDGVVGAADYHHIEANLLPKNLRNYNEKYWESRVFAPSSLLFYLGVSKKVPKLEHHSLFFDADLGEHAKEIYKDKKWPANPLFYVCCPSKTDETVAPEGSENLFILMPLAPGIEDNEEIREKYYHILLDRLEKFCGTGIKQDIVYKRSYCIKDFVNDYNSYKGNAYGLANTLKQTANFKPKLKNRKVKNLVYAGQLTVPGPGVPPSIISGQVAAEVLMKQLG